MLLISFLLLIELKTPIMVWLISKFFLGDLEIFAILIEMFWHVFSINRHCRRHSLDRPKKQYSCTMDVRSLSTGIYSDPSLAHFKISWWPIVKHIYAQACQYTLAKLWALLWFGLSSSLIFIKWMDNYNCMDPNSWFQNQVKTRSIVCLSSSYSMGSLDT